MPSRNVDLHGLYVAVTPPAATKAVVGSVMANASSRNDLRVNLRGFIPGRIGYGVNVWKPY